MENEDVIKLLDRIETKLAADKRLLQSVLGDLEYLRGLVRSFRIAKEKEGELGEL